MSQAATDTRRESRLDWNQVGETVRMLHLATAQVEAAMRDSNASVAVLTDTFTAMAESLDRIDGTLNGLPDASEGALIKAGIHDDTREVAAKVRQAIIAFQFYDKLMQRLDHASRGLASLAELVGDRDRLYDPAQWAGLQDQILAKYTMAEERAMFEAVMAGASVTEALQCYLDAHAASDSGGDIELF
jgi:hypothetical protein